MENMDNFSDSIMDNSIMDVSSSLIEVIDLTRESPRSTSHLRSCIHAEVASTRSGITGSSNHYRGLISPIVLGITEDNTQTRTRNSRGKRKVPCAASSDEVLTLDDTIEDNKTCYTVQSDNKEPVLLTCPICLEALSSKLKPLTTRCGHLFCLECLQTFLRTNKKCPTCKAIIALRSCTRLYL